MKGLSRTERNVTLMIDEVEFVKGELTVNCENNQATKTVVTFIIKSAGGKYIDVVALVSVSNLTTEFLYIQYQVVIKAFWEVGFTVAELIVDNHTTNLKFYEKLLWNDESKISISQPKEEKKKIHLLFDPLHNFKNVYNSSQRLEVLECPSTLGRYDTLGPNFAQLR
uniref:Putative LOC100214709 [Hydra vulgaris] n=1 Tax=Lepeophtheirus salmonis TaxID=72036 RepID=A0A0K2TCS1_LEPSM